MVDRDTLQELYGEIYSIRYYNERLEEEYEKGNGIPSGIHGSMGQEASAVGVCQQLWRDDWVFATHRSSHVAIAKGTDLKKLVAEQLGKEGGVCNGKAGEQHILDDEANFVSGAIVAQHLPSATGVALSHKKQGNDNIVVGYLGDGAANQGGFYECMNFASVHNLPMVFVIEDNSYGISSPKAQVTAVENNSERARGQNMPGKRVEGNDVLTIYETAKEAIERAREGRGPTLLEIETHRFQGHFFDDPEQYRDEDEVSGMWKDDCLPKINSVLRDNGVTESEIETVKSTVEQKVDSALQYAKEQPYPDASIATKRVFSTDVNGGA